MSKFAGWFILGVLIAYLLSYLLPGMTIVLALLSWSVPLLSLKKGKNPFSTQTIFLFTAGLFANVFSVFQGVFLGWSQIVTINLPLLAMFVAVSFLSLTTEEVEEDVLPKGFLSAVLTTCGIYLLGAVINLSALFLFGDRINQKGVLNNAQLISLSRAFCAAAWWSPFFIATGVALTYSPGMIWHEVLVPGLLMGFIALSYTLTEVVIFQRDIFLGYPLKKETLIVPFILAALVIVFSHLYDDVSILLITCIISPCGSFLFMKSRPRSPAVRHLIHTKLVSLENQFSMLLAAGVFSTGIKSLTQVYPVVFDFSGCTFNPVFFAVALALMILIGIIGVHPIISISIISPLILPIGPDPSQLGFLFLSSWAISAAISPFSIVGISLTSRYHASPKRIVLNNWHYALVMWAISCAVNSIYFS